MKLAFRLLPYLYLVLATLVFLSVIFVLVSMISLTEQNAQQLARSHELVALTSLVLIGAVLATIYILNAIFLLKRVRRKASLILSLMSCIGFPFGTILGIVSLFVLTRETVKGEYAGSIDCGAH